MRLCNKHLTFVFEAVSVSTAIMQIGWAVCEAEVGHSKLLISHVDVDRSKVKIDFMLHNHQFTLTLGTARIAGAAAALSETAPASRVFLARDSAVCRTEDLRRGEKRKESVMQS